MADQAEFIAKVTRALNELGGAPEGLYLRVLLTEEYTHQTVGAWCDEFGPDAWYFDTDPRSTK